MKARFRILSFFIVCISALSAQNLPQSQAPAGEAIPKVVPPAPEFKTRALPVGSPVDVPPTEALLPSDALMKNDLPNEKRLRLERLVVLLEEMVNISSDSREEVEGVNKVQAVAARELKKLKFKVEEVQNPDPLARSGRLIVATFPGENPQYLTLLAHADTVFSAEEGFEGFKRLEDEARGSGVLDNKGGILIGVEALRLYLEQNPRPPYSIRFVISPNKEAGSTGFLSLYEQWSLTSVAVFGLEPALEGGDIINSHRGDRWYDVTVRGREAHAGRAHDYGINACHELAVKIEKLQKLTDYRREVTISVGSVRGGRDKFAVVCGEAQMKLDVRFSDLNNRARVLKKVEAILNATYVKAKKDGAGAVTTWKIVNDPKPFPESSSARPLVDLYKKILRDVEGSTIQARRSGGSSDINFFYRPGLVMLDGLGPVGSGIHTRDERIELRSLLTRSEALSKLLQAASL